MLSSELSVEKLAQRCQQESKKYLAGHPHDEIYCLKLFRRAILDNNQEAWGSESLMVIYKPRY